METLVGYLLLAVPFVGAYAMFALGITVIYRASRVLNLAHGAMAMIPAFVMYSLVKVGIHPLLALPVAVASGALLGVGVEALFVRRLRPQGPTAQTVGTVAASGLLIALAAKIWGTTPLRAPLVFPKGALRLADNAIRLGEVGLFLTGVVVALVLFAFFRYTSIGLGMRGAAENRNAASLMGIDPDRMASGAWALGGALAGLAGVLLAAVTELDPYNLSYQVLPAFVAVLLGGLESLPGGLAGSGVAGLTYSVVPLLQRVPVLGVVLGSQGGPQIMLTALAIVVMFLRGRRFALSADSSAGLTGGGPAGIGLRLPGRRVLLLAAFLAVIAIPIVAPFSVLGDTLLAMYLALAAASVVVATGWVGQITLAQASFVGVAALTTGMMVRGWHVEFPANLVLSAAIAALAAAVLGVVALRVRGLYLAVATLIFAWMADSALISGPWLGASGGSSTMPSLALGTPGTIPYIDFTDRRVMFFVMAAVLVTCFASLGNLRHSKAGRALFAIRGSETAAASLGIDVVRYKLVAFMLAGALAGVAGNLLIMRDRTVVPVEFTSNVSLQFLAIAVVGGLSSLGGALAAGGVFAALEEIFFRVPFLAGWLEVVSAGLLTVVLLVYPGGLAALPASLARRLSALGVLRRDGGEAAAMEAVKPIATSGLAQALGDRSVVNLNLPRESRAALLRADGITVKFGGLTAVNNVSMAVHRGEVVGLMGPNGAGKTTLFNAILGFNEPTRGTVKLFDTDATRMAPHQRARLGVGRTFQVLQLFRELTVFENVLVATHLRNHSGLFSNLAAASGTVRSEIESRESVRQVLRALGLEALAQSPVAGLPFGTLRMVELARALASGAELILLDEPASGLNEAETDRLSAVVSDLRSMGLSILLIEHDVRMLVGLADYIYVVDQGRLIAEGTAAHIQRDPQVVAAYLGSEVAGGDDSEPLHPEHETELAEQEVTV